MGKLLCAAYAVMESLAVVCTLMNRALHIPPKSLQSVRYIAALYCP